MVGLLVLEIALALVLHNRLQLQLVNTIFTVQFLDKLDSEVASCYSKVITALTNLFKSFFLLQLFNNKIKYLHRPRIQFVFVVL